MDLDTNRIRELLDKRDEIDSELQSLFTTGRERKPIKCSLCQGENHTARTCPKKQSSTPQ